MWYLLRRPLIAYKKPVNYLCKQCSRNIFRQNNNNKFYFLYKQKLRTDAYFYIIKRDAATSAAKSALPKGGKKFDKSEVKRLISLMKPEKWKLTGAIGLLFISSTVTMAVPFALGKVIDVIYTKDSAKMRENLNKLCLTLTGVFLLGAACNFGRVYLMNLSGQRITKNLREKVFKSIISQETAFFDRHRTGELINRLSADTSLVSQSVTMNISDGLRSTIMVVAGVSMMFYMSPQLAIVGLTVVPPVAGLAVVYGKFVRNITKSVQDTLADANNVAEERISNIRTVKSFSRETAEIARYRDKMETVFQLAKREALAKGIFYGMTGFSGNAIILSVLYYGGIMVSESNITVGNLSSFLLYAAYIGVSLGGLSNFYSEMNRGLGASSRLWELMDRVPQIPVTGGLIPSTEVKGEITFKDVIFSYPSRDQHRILNGLNLVLNSGKVTAVVGSSGSGKSTLAALLLRLYDPQGGQVMLDGKSVQEYDPVWLRGNIGTVSQEPVLFSGTIRENIIYGHHSPDSVTLDEIIAVAKESNSLNFIETFPDKFDTKVGEKGIMLSGGQKQRIAIARALIKKPKILLLDEATSALDAESEYLVQEALQRILKGRTVLTIAHRLSTIKSADVIAVLDKGQISDIGTYQELISKEGPFKNLIKHQAVSN
ncbi:ATP-binding cassette sub-family B member 10, mitochondrial-like [Planococcus citri]|uniref:ATP-binding cassette sub-family B member 10, mitochondrial-like n=1 Tax=Planococcus citri TaxID=170843 RepID=UPI0031F77D5F